MSRRWPSSCGTTPSAPSVRCSHEPALTDDGLIGPAQVREIAARLELRPSKSHGQNFVIDPNTIRKIVRLAGLKPKDAVLEVGPGIGSLTLGLLSSCSHVTAIEIEPVLADELPATVAARLPEASSRLLVVEGDALRVDLPLPGPAPTALVANLPYNVSVPVLLRLMSEVSTIEHGLVMVQSEVADRLAAKPGSRIYGVPSVKMQWYADVRRVGSVSPSVFWPEPRVDSGLVAFVRHDRPKCRSSRDEVFACIDAAFAQRRKSLRSALAGWAGGSAASEVILRRAGVDPASRGEVLAIGDFSRIADERSDPSPA